MHRTWIASAAAAALLASCSYEASLGEALHSAAPNAPSPSASPEANAPDVSPHKLDVLFVVDNSGSMGEEQASLAHNFNQLIAQLEVMPGGLPSVHIGITTTDLGAGLGITSCSGDGDNGALQSEPRIADCAPPAGAYISDEIADDGSRVANYEGSLADTFACIGLVGTTGCGFEQNLESMRRALLDTSGQNGGFLRDDAHLALIFIGDEDDCSAADPGLFDTSQSEIDSTLGPLTSFRCVEFGTECDDGPISREPGSYASCGPSSDSELLFHPDEFVEFVTELKGDASKVIVSVVAGDRGGLTVASDELGFPRSDPSCESEGGVAFAGYRLGYFADQFENSLITSICTPDLSGALTGTAMLIANALTEGDGGVEEPVDSTSDVVCGRGPVMCCSASGGAGGPLVLGLALVLGCAGAGRRSRRRR